MNIREISDVFKDTADEITAIKSYNFGWASDRVRQGNTEDFQELNEFPRVFFAVPTITGSDQTRKQDTYQVTLFFDDLLGYDNEGDEDPTLQIDKWANLQQYANYFIQRLNKIKQSILPNYLFIPEAPSITFDSFTGIQRMITVQLSFNLVVPTNCDPGVITLVQCIANIVTSSNLTASLKSIIKFAASLEGRATVTADIALVQKVASSLNAFGTLTGDINFVQKAQAALLTSSSVTGNIIIPKLVQASLTGAGTTAADLTVTAAASLLLDLYPSAAVAYSLRKLRTAYTGSAIRVRRSSDNTEQDIGFVAGELDTVSLLAFCGVGNGFVTTWYDQSGNARNSIMATAANQPQIVDNGLVLTDGNNIKPAVKFDGTNDELRSSYNLVTNLGNRNFYVVHRSPTTPSSGLCGIFGSTDGHGIAYINSQTLVYNDGGVNNPNVEATSYTYIMNKKYLTVSIYVNANGSNSQLYNNDVSSIPKTSTYEIGLTALSIGGRTSGGTFPTRVFTGNIQECILWYGTLTTRTNIQTNINAYYGIY